MFGTTQRDPMLDLLHHLEHRIGRTFNEPLRGSEWPVPEAVTTAWLPLVDIFEEPDVIRLVAEVPGVKPEDVKITVESNLLTIKGTKEQLAEEKAEKVTAYAHGEHHGYWDEDAAQGLPTRRSRGDPADGRDRGDERWPLYPGHGQGEADPG